MSGNEATSPLSAAPHSRAKRESRLFVALSEDEGGGQRPCVCKKKVEKRQGGRFGVRKVDISQFESGWQLQGPLLAKTSEPDSDLTYLSFLYRLIKN